MKHKHYWDIPKVSTPEVVYECACGEQIVMEIDNA